MTCGIIKGLHTREGALRLAGLDDEGREKKSVILVLN
jgi:hypothetical protein